MSNLDKVSERNRVTKLGIDAMITNYLRLERENVALRDELKDCSAAFDRQQEMLDRNAEQIAVLRDALSRLVEVHDAMGGMCSPERAEEALKEEGK